YPRTVGERSSDKGQSAACCRCFKLSDQRTVGGEKFDSRICGDVYIGKYKTETCHGRWNLRPWDEKQSFHLCRVFHHEETLGAEHLKKVCVGWIYRTEPHSRIGRIAGLGADQKSIRRAAGLDRVKNDTSRTVCVEKVVFEQIRIRKIVR